MTPPPLLRLTRLRLRDFRNYADLTLTLADAGSDRIAVITGPNGSGKTNLLEAVSLLVPGRGLRGAPTGEFARRTHAATAPRWGINARLTTPAGPLEIGTGTSDKPDRRAFLLDGATPASHAAVAERLAIVWLTPQMDVLFQEPPSGRRRFLDRLVCALAPAHARQLAAHDTSQSQRAKLLAAGRADPAWLAGLEHQIARHATAATAGRLALVDRLNQALQQGAAAGFPAARLTLRCPIADRLRDAAALAVEDWLRERLAAARAEDARSGSAACGAHRADLALADAATGLDADLASTGQRKALLIGVILGHAALIAAQRGAAPILLLDEPMVHLDAAHRARLCTAAIALAAQLLLTGTDAASFDPLCGRARFVNLDEA